MSIDVIKIFDVIVLLLGVFLLFGAFQVKKGIIPHTFIPADVMTRCYDLEGMKNRLFPVTLLFAIVSLAYGVYGILFDFKIVTVEGQFISFLNVLFIVMFISSWVVFSKTLKKAIAECCS
jgi:hypothetical protein